MRTLSYDPAGALLAVTETASSPQRVWQTAYDRMQRVRKSANADGTFRMRQYDAAGNLVGEADELGHWAQFLYDDRNRLSATILPDGNVIRIAHDGGGRVVRRTDAAGVSFEYVYDVMGRMTQQIVPDPNSSNPLITRYSYDAHGNLEYVVNPGGSASKEPEYTTQYAHDCLGRVTSTILPDPDGGTPNRPTASYTYYPDGDLRTATDARNQTTTYRYDALGRLTHVIDPLEADPLNPTHPITVLYDASGNIISTIDADGNSSTYRYDNLNRPVAESPQGLIGFWTLDSSGGQTAIDTWGGHDGQLTGGPSFVAGHEGNALHFDGQDDSVRLDALPVNTNAAGKNTVAFWMKWDGTPEEMPFTWDGPLDLWFSSAYGAFGFNSCSGDLLGIAYADLDNTWVHVAAVFANGPDWSSGVKLYINGAEQTLTQYGTPATTATVTPAAYLSGVHVYENYAYAGLLDDLRLYNRELSPDEVLVLMSQDPQELGVRTFHYDVNGNLVSAADGQGNTIRYLYDRANRPVLVTDALGACPGDPDHTNSTWYDAAGKVLFATDALGRTTGYDYNARNLLTRVTLPDPDGPGPLAGSVSTLEYDANGNLTASTDPRGFTTWQQYDSLNRLTGVTDALGYRAGDQAHTTTFGYDRFGNLEHATDPLGRSTTYHYDHLNRLTQLELPDPDGNPATTNTPIYRYGYDANSNLEVSTDPRAELLGQVGYTTW